jgi:hypothetical protein
MILNVITAITLAIKIKIAKVGYITLLKTIMLSAIPPDSGRRNNRRDLLKNVI